MRIHFIVFSCISMICTASCGGTEAGTSSSSGGNPSDCGEERITEIGPLDKVSTGEVLIVSEANSIKTLFIDATAGGIPQQANNPWIYIHLGTASRVDISDVAAETSAAWDLALKRAVIRTNSGDGGPGDGGAAFLKDKPFDMVSDADAQAAMVLTEHWFDAACVAKKDPGGYLATTFDGWYDYGGTTTHAVTPHPGTFVVRSGDGQSLYRVEIKSYYANPDGTEGTAGARYLIQYALVAPS